jgi:two-component system LytT family response regulator
MKSTITHRFSFLTRSKLLLFSPEQIIRLEAFSNYTYIYFTDHSPILMAKVLSDYEELLGPYGFIRTHKSHLVNRNYIAEYDRSGVLRMTDDSKAMVSRRKKHTVFGILRNLPAVA